MKTLAPVDKFPEIYPTMIPEKEPFRRVRGPGRFLWAARAAAETLDRGSKVWVKLKSSTPEEYFSALVGSAPGSGSGNGSTEYDFSSDSNKGKYPGGDFFGDYSFSETVGLWLERGSKEAANLLSPFISTEGFVFSPDEFLDLLERLRVALRRYGRLPGVSNGLEDLNTGFFRHRSLEESAAFIQSHLAEYLRRGADLHRRFLLSINHHARSAATEKRRELRTRMRLLEEVRRKITVAGEFAGRQQKKAIPEITVLWEGYRKTYRNGDDGGVPNADLQALRTAVDKEVETVASGFRLLARELKTDGLSLNALTVDPRHGDPGNLRELENSLNELLREVDEAGLYQLPLRMTDAATTPRQLQQLDSLLAKLRNTERHLGELPMFYDRRHFWYAQPAQLRRLMAPLLDLPPQDWETAFSSWYFERCLEREERPERFFRSEGEFVPAGTENVAPKERTRGKMVFLAPGANWPAGTAPDDLLLDLSGEGAPDGKTKARTLTIVPLSDTTAVHLAISGHRDPVLLFGQLFQPLHPPRWRARLAESPPVGPENSVLLQLREGSPWLALSEWDGIRTEKLNVFLPARLNPREEKALVENWELLIGSPEIIFFHTLSPNAVTQGLLSDGINGAFIISVLLRAAEAAEATPFDHQALTALGRELRTRCKLPEPAPHPLAVQFNTVLRDKLPGYFTETHVGWRDTLLPLVLQSPSGKKTVLLPDGRLPGLADDATETARQEEMKSVGFRVLGLNALNLWEDLEGEVTRVIDLVKE